MIWQTKFQSLSILYSRTASNNNSSRNHIKNNLLEFMLNFLKHQHLAFISIHFQLPFLIPYPLTISHLQSVNMQHPHFLIISIPFHSYSCIYIFCQNLPLNFLQDDTKEPQTHNPLISSWPPLCTIHFFNRQHGTGKKNMP